MERMGGSLHGRDAGPGLGVVVEMPLARERRARRPTGSRRPPSPGAIAGDPA